MSDVIDTFPPTPTQEGMLTTALRGPHRGVEIEQLIVRFGERVDAARLREGVLGAQLRFDVLRSAFRWEGPRTEQVVFREAPLAFETLTLDADEAAVESFLRADRERGFDMAMPPLHRTTLLRAHEDILVFTFHHAILDGRSYRAVLEHILDHLDGRTPESVPGGPSFGDYCRAVAAHDFTQSRAYFARALAGGRTTPIPSTEGRQGEGSGIEERRREATLHLADISGLVAIGRDHGPSVANAVQAAWAWVLARQAGTSDVVLGTTRAGRVPWIPDVDRIIGCLIDTLPLRIAVDEAETPRAFLDRVRARNLELRDHEQVSLTDVLGQAELSLSSLVVVERYDLQPTFRSRSGADARRRFSLREQSDFPLLLAAYQDETRLRLVLEHDENQLDGDAASRLLARVARALEHFGSGTDQPLSSLDLFVADEERTVRAWARGPAADRADVPADVPARFAATARARASDVAVVDESGETVTYQALFEGALRIAYALSRAGTQRGDVVLVLLPRSARWVATLWGIWRADAVYLPLDPMWPDARIAAVHDDVAEAGGARSLVVVVDASSRERAIRSMPRARVVDVDAAWDPLRTEAGVEHDSSGLRDASRLAYLLFTSGTTGRPKGARISHRALAAHADAALGAFGLGPSDRVLQFTALGFDVSLEEVVPTLISGAQLVLRSDAASSDLDVFLAEIDRRGVTVLNLPSGFLHELALGLEEGGRRLPDSVRLVIVGGERPAPESFARFLRLHPHVRLVNAYGPTEVTITSVMYAPLDAEAHADGRREIPIGRAFGSCRAHVVVVPAGADGVGPHRNGTAGDDTRPSPPRPPRLAAIDEPGELWIAGPQVASGYLARPEATERAFVPDPFAAPHDVDRTAYRTGDLVKLTADGQLVFLRRLDRQIKLRGHRIEPAEIEAAIRRQHGVVDAIVVAAGEAVERSLVAFVTDEGPSSASRIEPDALRRAVARELPAAMVPSVIVAVDALPLTPAGKVDREQLAARADSILREPSHAVLDGEPRNDIEAWLMPIFAEVLRLEYVDLDQSFFELGGHSLLALRLLARLRSERPDLQIPLATLFANPSVRELARAIHDLPGEQVPTLVRLNLHRGEIDDEIPLFCVCGVQLYASLARAMERDRPVFGAFLPVETVAVVDAKTALDVPSMASSYIELIKRQRPHGPYLLGGESFGGLLAYEMAQQLVARGEEVRLVALFDTILPRAFAAASFLERSVVLLRRIRRRPDALVEAVRRRSDLAASRLRRRLAELGMVEPAQVVLSPEEIRDAVFKNAGDAYDPVIRPYGGRVLIFRARGGLGGEGETVHWDLGWSSLVRTDTPVHGVEGDHLGILREPGASEIARVIRTELARERGIRVIPESSRD